MASKCMKTYSILSLVIRKMQIKYNGVPPHTHKIKNAVSGVGEEVENWEASYTVGRNVKW